MATVYPELFSHFNQFTEPQIIELHRILTDYVSQLSLTLQQRDDEVDLQMLWQCRDDAVTLLLSI